METSDVCLDCDEGRRLGCATFCCRLIVRLTEAERERGVPGVERGMNCVPKAPEGFCIHLDRTTSQCRIWSERPRVCREYDCNQDALLTVVLKSGFRSLVQLALEAARSTSMPSFRVPSRGRNGETKG